MGVCMDHPLLYLWMLTLDLLYTLIELVNVVFFLINYVLPCLFQ